MSNSVEANTTLQQTSHSDLFIKSQTFKGHTDSVSALVFDDSHGILYTASLDCSIKVIFLTCFKNKMLDAVGHLIHHRCFKGLDCRDRGIEEEFTDCAHARDMLPDALEGCE